MPISASGEKLYFGLAATNSTDGKESIEFLDPAAEEQLEYDVAKLIYQLSTPRSRSSAGCRRCPCRRLRHADRPAAPAMAVYRPARTALHRAPLEPTLTTIDADVDVLVHRASEGLPPAALFAIDQFALRGGHMLAFVDPMRRPTRRARTRTTPWRQMTADKSSHLEPLLDAWGVDFKSDQVVADLERGLRCRMRQGEPPLQHIAILGLDSACMAKDVITARLDSINMATAGSLKPAAGSQAQIRAADPHQQAGRPDARAAHRDDAGPRHAARRLQAHGRTRGRGARLRRRRQRFPEGPPAGVTAAPDALKESAKPLNVIVFADTDLLADFIWVQQRNFFGQTRAQPFANNGDLVCNALDNLAGSTDLISVRGRATYTRPFDRVEALRRNADAQLPRHGAADRAAAAADRGETQQVADRAAGLGEAILSADQAREIERFQADEVRMRKEKRAVQAELGADIKSLGLWIKVINVILVPALCAVLALLVSAWHRRRRHAIAMLRKKP